MSAATRETVLSRQYVKLCDIRDFDDPDVRARIDDITPGVEPPTHLHRKHWECAMMTLFLEDSGLLREDARVLSVGAGHETVLFWLANRVAGVVATDIYGEGSFSEHEAERTMLTDPASFSPYPYRESHLEVRHMDARELQFPDNSFDAVFSLSSIEHFGSWADIRRSASEMGRVLRPGGGVFIATECFLGRSAFGPRALQGPRSRPGGTTRIFTPRTLISEIVGPSGLELMQPLDTTAPETSANVFELLRGGGITSTTGAEYPHIALRVKKRLGIHTQSWTSVGLAMSKPSGQGLRQAISGRLSERVTNTKAPKTGLGQPSAGGSAPPCARAQVVPPQHRPGAALVPRPAQPTSARRCTSACAGRLIVVKTQTGNHNSDWLRRHSSGQPLSSMTP